MRLGLLSVKELNTIVRTDGLVEPDSLMDALLYHTDNLAVDLTAAKFHPRVGRFEHVAARGYPSGQYGSQAWHRRECGLDAAALIDRLAMLRSGVA